MGRPPNNCNICCGDTPPESDCYTSICVAFIDTNAVEAMTVEEANLLGSKIRRWSLAYPNRLLFVFEVESPHEVEYGGVTPDESLKYQIFSVKAEHDKSGNPLNIPSAKIARDNGNGSVAEVNDPWGTIVKIKDAYNVPFGGDSNSGYPARTKSPKELFDEANQVLIHVENSSTISPSQISATVAKFKADAQSAGYSVADANAGFTRDFFAPFAYNYCCKNNQQLNFLYLCGIDQSYCFPTKIEFTKQPQEFGVFREYCFNTVFDPDSPYEEVCETCVDPDTAEQNQIITYGATLTNSLGDEINEAINYELQAKFFNAWVTIEGLGVDLSSEERSLNVLLENWKKSNSAEIHPFAERRIGLLSPAGHDKDIYPCDFNDAPYQGSFSRVNADKISVPLEYSGLLVLSYSAFSGEVFLYRGFNGFGHEMIQKVYYDDIGWYDPPEGQPFNRYCKDAIFSNGGGFICLLFGGRTEDGGDYRISILKESNDHRRWERLIDYDGGGEKLIYFSERDKLIFIEPNLVLRLNSDDTIDIVPFNYGTIIHASGDGVLAPTAVFAQKDKTIKGYKYIDGIFEEFFSYTIDQDNNLMASLIFDTPSPFYDVVYLTVANAKVVKIFERLSNTSEWTETEYTPEVIKRYPNSTVTMAGNLGNQANKILPPPYGDYLDLITTFPMIVQQRCDSGENIYFEFGVHNYTTSRRPRYEYGASYILPRCERSQLAEDVATEFSYYPPMITYVQGEGVTFGYHSTYISNGRSINNQEPVIRSFRLVQAPESTISSRGTGPCLIKTYDRKFRIKASYETFDSRVTSLTGVGYTVPEANLEAYSSEFTLRDYETREYTPPVYYKIYVSDGSEPLCDLSKVHYAYPTNVYQWKYTNSQVWSDFYYDSNTTQYFIDVLSGRDVHIRINPAYNFPDPCNSPYILDQRIFFWKTAQNCLGYFNSYIRSGTTGYIIYPNVIKNDTIRATYTCTEIFV